jgi:hypothetical protein
MPQEQVRRGSKLALSVKSRGQNMTSSRVPVAAVYTQVAGRSDVPSLPAGAKIAVIEGPMSEAIPFTVRLKFPGNYQIPAHWHPAVERVTVLSGAVNMGVGDKLDMQQSMTLSPGSMIILQPKTNHYVFTKEESIVQLNGAGPFGDILWPVD